MWQNINSIKSFLRRYLHIHKASNRGYEWELECPNCGNEKNFHFNIYSRKGQCWICKFKVGSMGGIIYKLKEKGRYIEFASHYHDHKQFTPVIVGMEEEVSFKSLIKELTANKEIIRKLKPVPLPEEYKPITNIKKIKSEIVLRSIKYILKRGVTDEQIKRHKIGYCGTGRQAGMIIIPVFNKAGEQVYWTARRLTKLTGKTKFYNPPKKDRYFSKDCVLYNINNIYGKREDVVLVEGWRDVLSIDDRAIGIFGKSLSDHQLDVLVSSFKSFTVLLDPDAYPEGDHFEVARKLAGFSKEVYVAELPVEAGDPGKCSKKYLENILNQKKLFTEKLVFERLLVIKKK